MNEYEKHWVVCAPLEQDVVREMFRGTAYVVPISSAVAGRIYQSISFTAAARRMLHRDPRAVRWARDVLYVRACPDGAIVPKYLRAIYEPVEE